MIKSKVLINRTPSSFQQEMNEFLSTVKGTYKDSTYIPAESKQSGMMVIFYEAEEIKPTQVFIITKSYDPLIFQGPQGGSKELMLQFCFTNQKLAEQYCANWNSQDSKLPGIYYSVEPMPIKTT